MKNMNIILIKKNIVQIEIDLFPIAQQEGIRRRSPEGIVDCILERTNQILLAKVEIIKDLSLIHI